MTLEDVAAFLVLAPLMSTLAAVALIAAWIFGGRRLGPKSSPSSPAEAEAPVQAEVSVSRRT
jgi:hypothetical protein